MTEIEIVSILKDETRYNYYEIIRDIQRCPYDGSILVNTLELFAFGNYPHYIKYQAQFIELDSELLLKLIKLTILAMCSENEGSTILTIEMERQYGIESAIRHYYEVIETTGGDSPACHLLESILFSMIDDCLISIKLDDKDQKIRVIKSHKLRDCYNKNDITLKVLCEEDIPRNAGTSYAKLEKWLHENIQPTRKEYTRK